MENKMQEMVDTMRVAASERYVLAVRELRRVESGEVHESFRGVFESRLESARELRDMLRKARTPEELASALAPQPAADGGFTAADMMDARQEGRKEAQQLAACPKCGGTGEADSGGVMPWGAPAMLLCECQQPAAVDGALRAEVAAVWNAMPSGTRYLDPPDGGDVPLHEQVRRMADDAARAEQLQAELDNRWAQGVHTCHDKCQRVACVLRRQRDFELKRAERLEMLIQQPEHSLASIANAEHARAERLAEALRDARDYVTTALREEREKFSGHEDCSDIPGIEADLHKIDAALRDHDNGRAPEFVRCGDGTYRAFKGEGDA